jgi:hypothetical protein
MKHLCSTVTFALLALASVGSLRAQELKPLKYDNPGLAVHLQAGLWALPMPMDYDRDGDNDLLVVVNDVPGKGIYFFENTEGRGAKLPVFRPGVRVSTAMHNIQASYVNGEPRVMRIGEEYVDFRANQLSKPVKLKAPKDLHEGRIRHNHWRYVDYDGDGDQDILVGLDDWADYGWDDAFDANGRWTNGPGHGYVYLLRNEGSDVKPKYDNAGKVEAGGRPIDVYGLPSPCFADFDHDGDLDLICGEFLDGFTYFRNTGTRTAPLYAAGRRLARDGKPIVMDLEMINPIAFDWDGDGDEDLIVGQEDGRVALIENTGRVDDSAMPVFERPVFFRQWADDVMFGVLTTPVAFDFDGDGDQDIVSGNSGGYVGFIENLGRAAGASTPKWAAPRCLEAGGQVMRFMAGENGSIQGPCEAKWGYTALAVADWDGDALPDVIVNAIQGEVVWFRNIGTRAQPKLAAAKPIEVEWPNGATRPQWNWKQPSGKQLITQWRTTPVVADVTGDGLADLVMLDRDGFLSLFERTRADGELKLRPPRHVFFVEPRKEAVFDANHAPARADLAKLDAQRRIPFYRAIPGQKELAYDCFADRSTDSAYGNGDGSLLPLRLNAGWAGRSGRRKIHLADVDGDGRLDLLVNSTNVNVLRNVGDAPGGGWIFRDEGRASSTVLAGHDTSPAAANFDADAAPDLLVGAEDGRFYFRPNFRAREP